MILSIHNEKPARVPERFPWAESLCLVLAGLCLLGSLAFPMWRITLDAPQYPEGMGMQIWSRTIVGENDHDLDIINELNHYIGMKKIVPESIPELRLIMPLTLAFSLACLLAAWRPRVWSTGLVLAALTALGAYGMFDFWKWEYDYGHNLNPMAAIKVPGMSYQPPLIGTAKLLNFLSTSWPAAGGLLLFAGGLLIACALGLGIVRAVGLRKIAALTHLPRGIVGGAALCLLFVACGKGGPSPILWGDDICHHCKMTLVQKGFAAQRVNAKGKAYTFDSIECLLADLAAQPLAPGEKAFVSDWSRPEAAVMDAETMVYLRGGHIPGPMGNSLAAFQSKDSAQAYQGKAGGSVLEWAGLK